MGLSPVMSEAMEYIRAYFAFFSPESRRDGGRLSSTFSALSGYSKTY